MTIVIRKRHDRNYYYFKKGAEKYLYLGPVDQPSEIKPDRIAEALRYTRSLDSKNIGIQIELLKLLPQEKRDEMIFEKLEELDKTQSEILLYLMSNERQSEYLESKISDLQNKLKTGFKKITTEHTRTKIVVYGLSTEGYELACKMALNGSDVFIVDESAHMAISLKSEIAKVYRTVTSLKEDEPLLGVDPVDTAISRCNYLFFAPRLRRRGKEMKPEILYKFKDATNNIMREGTTVVYCLPTGIGGNDETISFLEQITGFKIRQNISYYYYPLGPSNFVPNIVGSLDGKPDENLIRLLLTKNENKKTFVSIRDAEITHILKIIFQYPYLHDILKERKYDNILRKKSRALTMGKPRKIYLDDLTVGLLEINSFFNLLYKTDIDAYRINELSKLGFKPEYCNGRALISLARDCISYTERYVKRLIDEIRSTLKKNELKASRTKIVLVWTQDPYEMRGDKIDLLNSLVIKFLDHMGDVEIHQGPELEIFHSGKPAIIVACSKLDYDKISKNEKEEHVIMGDISELTIK